MTEIELLNMLMIYTRTHGKAPTIREIAKAMNRNISTIHKRLRGLEKKEYISIERYKKRGITILVGDKGDRYDRYIYDSEADIKEKTYD